MSLWQWFKVQKMLWQALEFETDNRYRIKDNSGKITAEVEDNHQAVNQLTFDHPTDTERPEIDMVSDHRDVFASIFTVQCYE